MKPCRFGPSCKFGARCKFGHPERQASSSSPSTSRSSSSASSSSDCQDQCYVALFELDYFQSHIGKISFERNFVLVAANFHLLNEEFLSSVRQSQRGTEVVYFFSASQYRSAVRQINDHPDADRTFQLVFQSGRHPRSSFTVCGSPSAIGAILRHMPQMSFFCQGYAVASLNPALLTTPADVEEYHQHKWHSRFFTEQARTFFTENPNGYLFTGISLRITGPAQPYNPDFHYRLGGIKFDPTRRVPFVFSGIAGRRSSADADIADTFTRKLSEELFCFDQVAQQFSPRLEETSPLRITDPLLVLNRFRKVVKYFLYGEASGVEEADLRALADEIPDNCLGTASSINERTVVLSIALGIDFFSRIVGRPGILPVPQSDAEQRFDIAAVQRTTNDINLHEHGHMWHDHDAITWVPFSREYQRALFIDQELPRKFLPPYYHQLLNTATKGFFAKWDAIVPKLLPPPPPLADAATLTASSSDPSPGSSSSSSAASSSSPQDASSGPSADCPSTPPAASSSAAPQASSSADSSSSSSSDVSGSK